jgi:septal ring factor EnvC (AmiA/AmiB activator)
MMVSSAMPSPSAQSKGLADLKIALANLMQAVTGDTRNRLARIEALLDVIQQQGIKLMTGLSDLQTAVATLTSSVSAAAAELTALATAAAGDPDATVESLAQQVNAQAAALTAAVAAVAPPPAPAPSPTPVTPPASS